MKYAIILLDNSAPSICYYENNGSLKKLMPFDVLESSIKFCRENDLYASIVYGNCSLTPRYRELLDTFPHVKIMPFKNINLATEEDICVLDMDDNDTDLGSVPDNNKLNLIIRLSVFNTKILYEVISEYGNKFKRLNVILKDVEKAGENDLNDYRINLQNLAELVYKKLSKGEKPDVSIITDRIFLGNMNNCEAGITHFSIAPNGKFYLCPGFYFSDAQNEVGSLKKGLDIKNSRLLEIENAPICSICDCYQCKRCIYLNGRMTMELNTPSHQQCVISHHERNAAGLMLIKLHDKGFFPEINKIPALYYLDPFDLIKGSDGYLYNMEKVKKTMFSTDKTQG